MDQQAIYAILDTMLEQPRLGTPYQKMRSEFEAQGRVAHGWEHVRRVIVNAAWVGSEEGADLQIVMPAIMLHDIGYVTNPEEPGKHPEHGARDRRRSELRSPFGFTGSITSPQQHNAVHRNRTPDCTTPVHAGP